MRELDTVWIHIASFDRPGIVIEVREDLARVAYGTRQKHEYPHQLVVSPENRQGRSFPLTTTTYFYGSNTEWRSIDDLRAGKRRCSFELFYEIRKLVEEYDATVEPI